MMDAGRLPWTAMRAFDALARTGSLNGAARELEVTASAVSQLVTSLEKRLGVQLAQRRSGARMQLTDAGRRYARSLHVAFRHMVRATERLTAVPAELPR